MRRKCIFAQYSGYVEYEQSVIKVFELMRSTTVFFLLETHHRSVVE